MLTSSCHAFLFRRSHFLSAHIKTTTAKVLSCSFCSPLAHADEVLFFYSNVHRSVRVNRCHHHTVYTHVVAKFIRYMPHRVTCNDLIGLLKSCSVSRALGTNLHLLEIRYGIVHWRILSQWQVVISLKVQLFAHFYKNITKDVDFLLFVLQPNHSVY